MVRLSSDDKFVLFLPMLTVLSSGQVGSRELSICCLAHSFVLTHSVCSFQFGQGTSRRQPGNTGLALRSSFCSSKDDLTYDWTDDYLFVFFIKKIITVTQQNVGLKRRHALMQNVT